MNNIIKCHNCDIILKQEESAFCSVCEPENFICSSCGRSCKLSEFVSLDIVDGLFADYMCKECRHGKK